MFELNEAGIQAHASSESFRRGEDYYRRGAVLSLVRRGDVLHAEVAGSDFDPYDVRVVFDEAEIRGATCSCPYDWGGWCKHVVAALLACLHEPETVRETPSLEELLSGLDRDRLLDLLLRLAERNPSLADAVESELSVTPETADPDSVRRRIRSELRDYAQPYETYGRYGGDPGEGRRALERAWGLIEAGDGRGALPILEAITDEYMRTWEVLDYFEDEAGDIFDFFEELGLAWTEALLSTELSPSEKEDYGAKLDVWCGELGEYGAGESFGAAFRAVKQGWSYPPLVGVLEGRSPDDGFLEEISDDPLTIARLNVLERQGRHEEYLRLSDAADETVAHATMLARLGRTEDAVGRATERLADPEEVLVVAEALRERGETEAALRLGEHGLSLEGRQGHLAAWVRELAEDAGRRALALRAAVSAVRADPDLASYRRVRELAGEEWPEYQERLLDDLRRNTPYYPAGHVEVFLHEGLVGDAIAAVEESPVETLVALVADTAIESHPDWVIGTCTRKAEGIMEEGKSKYYGEAVSWLAKARDAYLAAGREDEWRAYLDGLIERHQRKYKLRPMLEDLGR